MNQNEKIITGDEEFYKEVTELFGTEVVQMYYLPKNTEFLMGDIDEEGKLVCALYQYEEHVLEYQIISNYRTRSYGYDIEDELLDETQINVSDVPITVKEYRLPDGEHQFVAQFEYENCAYVLNACISEAEFHKILKNLKFF